MSNYSELFTVSFGTTNWILNDGTTGRPIGGAGPSIEFFNDIEEAQQAIAKLGERGIEGPFEIHSTYEEEVTEIKLHAARAFFATAWADWNDEYGNTNVSGQEIMNLMPDEVDPAATAAADKLVKSLEKENDMTIVRIFRTAVAHPSDYADRPCDPEHFGHYLAMQAMGTGVGLECVCDDDAVGFEVPDVEFSFLDLDPEKYPT